MASQGLARGRAGLATGIGLVLVLVATSLLSLVWTPYPPADIDIPSRLQGPSLAHWLGTDPFGRDVASMLIVGGRNSLAIALTAVFVGLVLGVGLGAAAAASGGWFSDVIMRLADFTFAFPALLSAILITAVLGPGAINAVLAIGIFNIPVFARVTRGAALQIWGRDYILAARAAGKGGLSITVEHVLPNVAGLLIVQASLQFALAILAEAGLSYLGFGTQPPNPSWGRMLNEAQTFMRAAPLLALFPGFAIAVSVLAFNLLGDGLRDLVDPKLARMR
ncbi:MAG: ABC transporter permease [Rhodospirillaceae bacterium]|nr:ABC transporter permease [Rhodospirillaceae bacterium]